MKLILWNFKFLHCFMQMMWFLFSQDKDYQFEIWGCGFQWINVGFQLSHDFLPQAEKFKGPVLKSPFLIFTSYYFISLSKTEPECCFDSFVRV